MTKVEIATKSGDKEVRPRLQQLSSVKKSLIRVGGLFLEGGLQFKVTTVVMVEIEVPSLQDWRSTSDGPLHVVFLVHLVSSIQYHFLTPVFSRFFTGLKNEFQTSFCYC